MIRKLLEKFRPAKKSKRDNSVIDVNRLEPRVMYSAVPGAELLVDAMATAENTEGEQQSLQEQLDGLATSSDSNFGIEETGRSPEEQLDQLLLAFEEPDANITELVFIDKSVSGYEELVADLEGQSDSEFEIVFIESDSDGVEQVTQTLAQYSGLEAIHFVTHGADGLIQLGNSSLSSGNLSGYSGDISGWQNALSSNADILFYGCNLAQSESGQDFLSEMAALTDADVAASDGLTGSAGLGGDWELEYEIGHVEADVVFSAAVSEWNYVLDTLEIATSKDTYIDVDESSDNYGSSTTLIVDQSGTGYGDMRTLLDFDLSVLGTGATINSVTLSMNATANTGNFDVNVYELTESWGEGTENGATDAASWDNRLDGTAWTTAGGTFDTTVVATSNTSTIGEHTWDITSLVQDWYSGAKTNHGILLGNADTGTNSVTYDSSESGNSPKLIIDYTPAQNVYVTGTEDGGLNLNDDGGNDLYLVADDGDAIFGGAQDLTIEVQFQSTNLPASTGSFDFISYATGTQANEIRFGVEEVFADEYRLNLEINGSSGYSVGYDVKSLFDGEKHTVTATWSNSLGDYEFFIDGVSVYSGTGLGTLHTIDTGGTVVIGRDQDTAGGAFDDDQYFSGTLYDIRVFDSVRTDPQVSGSFDSEVSRDEIGLVANWQFNDLHIDESNGTQRITETVSGNNLTLGRATSGGIYTESVVGLSLVVDENESNGTVVGQVTGTDVERTALINSLLAGDPDLVYNAETGKFYKAVTTPSTWTGASVAALTTDLNGVGGQLATIRNGAENAAVTQFAIDAGQEMWLGASDATVEGEWRWFEDGLAAEQFWSGDFTGSAVDGAYTDWQSGRPDNSEGGTQDYLSLRANGEWNDEDNADPNKGYIIEWDADEVLDNAGPIDEQPIVYSITSQTESGAFAINSDNGQITVADGTLLDYESNSAHALVVRMTDVDGNYREETITINLVDFNEAPTVAINSGLGVDEGATAIITSAMLNEGDPDDSGAEITYTLTADVVNGALRLNGTALGVNDTFTQADIDGNLLTYEHDGSETTSDGFDFSLADGGEDGVSSATGTFAITVNAVNDQPVFLSLDSTPTFVEDGAAVVLDADVTITDAELTSLDNFDGSTLTLVRNSGANGEDVFSESGLLSALSEGGSLTYNGTTIGTVTTNSGGTLVLTFDSNATNDLVNSVMQSIAYSNTSDEPVGSVQIDWTFEDNNSGAQGSGGSLAATGSTTVNLTASNDDPYNNGLLPTDISATEDTLSNVDLSQIDIVDPDHGGSSLTLKLTTSTGGNLFATTGGGVTVSGSGTGTMTLTGTQSDLNAFLDTASNIQYQHSATHTNGNDADQISVAINDNGNTGIGGGTDIALGTVNVDIAAVNDQPMFANLDATPTFVEDGAAVVLDADVTITDAELTGLDNFDGSVLTLERSSGPNGEDVFSASGLLSALSEGGSLTYNGTAIGTVTTNSGGTLVLTFDGNATNTLVNSVMRSIAYSNTSDEPVGSVQIDWTFEDNNSGAQGSGGSLTVTGSTTVSFAATNDDPYNNGLLPTDISVTEDTLSNVDLSQIDIVDPDHGGSSLTLKLTTSTGGNLFATTGSGVTVSGSGTGTMTLTGTQSDLNAFLDTSSNIQYQHSTTHTNGDDADQISVAINDNGNTGIGGGTDIVLGTVNVDIAAVNDQPVFSGLDAMPTFVEDGAAVVLDADVTITDAELTGLDNFDGSVLTLERSSGPNGEDVFSASGLLSALSEGGSLTYNGTTIGTVTTNSGGTLVLTFDSNATNALVNSVMQSIAYSNTSDEPSSSVQIDWTFEDNNSGTQGSGGSLAATGSTTVNLTASNDDPYNNGLLPTDISVTEDTLSNVDLSQIDIVDPDHGGSSLTLKLTTSTGGNLFATTGGGVTVSGGGTGAMTLTGTQSDLNAFLDTASNIQYQHSTTHTNGNDADQISVAINDNGNTGLGGGTDIALGTVNVDITAVNDAPAVAIPSSSYNATENAALDIHGTGFSVADVDESNSGATATLTVGEGELTFVVGDSGVTIDSGNGTSAVTISGTIQQINDLLTGVSTGTIVYQNNIDAPSTSTTISLTVNDLGNVGSDPGTSGDAISEEGVGSQTINISAVNDDPINTVPAITTVTEEMATTIAGISISDVDNTGTLTTRLQATNGVLNVTLSGSATISAGANGSKDLTILGSEADINATLASLTYTGDTNLSGINVDTLTVTTNDQGNHGSGGPLMDTDAVQIDIVGTADVPVTGNTSITLNEDGSYAIQSSDIPYADSDGDPIDHIQVTSLPVNGLLQLSGANVNLGDVISIVDINAGNLIYSPSVDGNGSAFDEFGFRVSDGVFYSDETATTSLINSSFNSNSEGFVYSDDVFGTSEPGNASGTHDNNDGFSGSGGLVVSVGGNTGGAASSGGWNQTFNLVEDGVVSVSVRYRLDVANQLEGGEFGEAILEIDGVRYGSDLNGSLAHIAGGGDSGWQQVTFEVELSAGSHNLVLGAFASSTNANNEMVDVYFDDVVVEAKTFNTFSFDVNAVNDAPVLDNTGDLSLSDITEDDTGSAGNTVAQILASGGDPVIDVDSGAVEGMSVTGVDNTNGLWEYSLDGSTWLSFAASGVSTIGSDDLNAVILDEASFIRFVPDADYNGSGGNITFRAWDQTDGSSAGDTGVDVSTNGGVTAFSAASETATINVLADNDAPLLGNNSLTILEGETVTITTSDLNATDIDNVVGTLTYQVSNVVNGQFELTSAPQSAITSFTHADVVAGDVVFVHDGGENAPAYEVTVNDGSLSDGPHAASITFTNINDAPEIQNLSGDSVVSFNDGTMIKLDSNVPVALADADGPTDFSGGTLTVTGNNFQALDQLRLDTSGALSLTAGFVNGSQIQVSGVTVGTLSGVSDSGVTITLNSNADATTVEAVIEGFEFATTSSILGNRSVDFVLNDGDGTANGGEDTSATANVSITVAKFGNGLVTTNEDTHYIFAATDFSFTGTTGTDLSQIVIKSLPVDGTLVLNGIPVSVEDVVSRAQIDSGQFRFLPDADENGPIYASFDFSVNQGNSSISILSGEPNSYTLGGGALASTDQILANADNFGASGTYQTSISVVAANSNVDAAYLAQGQVLFNGYVPDGSLTGAELTAIDNWVASGGILISNSDSAGHDSLSEHFGLTIGGTASSTWHLENDSHAIIDGPFGQIGSINDPISAAGTISYFDSGSLASGDVVLASDSVTGEPTIVLRQHGSGFILFTSDEGIFRANMTGSGTVSTPNDILAANIFAWAADQVQTSQTHTMDVAVDPVNDDPINVGVLPSDISAVEDTLSNVDLSGIDLFDVDSATGDLTMTLSTGNGGTLSASPAGGVVIGGSGTGSLTLTGTQAELNAYLDNAANIQFLSGLNANGNDQDSIQVDVTDNGNIGSGGGGTINLGTVNVDISAVNDQASFSNLDATPTYVEDTAAIVLDSDVTLFDQELSTWDDFNGSTLTLVRNGGANVEDVFSASGLLGAISEGGSLSYNGTSIGTVTTNSGGTLVLTFNSNATNTLVNSAMQAIAYSNTNDEPVGSVQLDWTFDDENSGLQGSGGSLVAIGSTTVSLVASNDDPYNNGGLPSDITVTEDVASNVDLSLLDIVDPDHGGGSLTVTLSTSTGGNLMASSAGGVSVVGSGTSSVTLTGTQDDLNSYLNNAANIQYQHSVTHTNGNDADQITVVINDNGNTGLGGGVDVTLGTVNVDISAVNDQASFSNLDATATYVEDTAAVVLDSDVTLFDQELSAWDDFNGSTLTLVRNGGANVEDVFSASGLLGALSEGGSLSYNGTSIGTVTTNSGGTLVLTFNSNATNALVNSAMQAIAYSNTNDEPVGSVQLDWTFDDENSGLQGSGGSLVATGSTTVSLVASNDDPYNNGGLPSDITVTEDVASNVDLSLLDIVDPDHGGGSLTVTLSTSTGGNLMASSAGGVSVVGSGTSSVTLTGTQDDLNSYLNNAANIQYQHSVTHTNGNDADQIAVIINDNGNTGLGGGADVTLGTVNVDILAVNDDPFNNGGSLPAKVTLTEDVTQNLDLSVLEINDVDVNADNMTVTISSTSGAIFNSSSGGGVTVSGNGSTSLQLNGSLADINTFLDTVSNIQVAGSPDSFGTNVDQISVVVSDNGNNGLGGGGNITLGVMSVDIIAVNDAAVATSIESGTLVYIENSGSVNVTNSIQLSDVDDTMLESAAIQITGNYLSGEDVLAFVDTLNISGSWDSATGTLTLSGTDTVANYQAALRAITYANTSDNPTDLDRTVQFVVNDGDNDSIPVTRNIDIVTTNDASVLSAVESSGLGYVENSGAVSITSSLDIFDVDDTLIESAQVRIDGNYVVGEDVLAFVDTLNITGSWDPVSGTLTLAGTDSIANYEAALRSVTYENLSDDPSTLTRTIDFVVDDGDGPSNTVSRDVLVGAVNDPPVASGIESTAVSYIENDPATVITSTISLNDLDDINFESATIQISGNYVNGEDLLSFVDTANIAGSFDALTGTLTLTGSDTIANYEAALRSVTYTNTSENPSNATRSVDFKVNDGALDSNTQTRTIDVSPVNDAPLANDDGPLVGNEASSFYLAPTLNDIDFEGDTLTITEVNGLALTPGGSAISVTGGMIELQPDGVTLTFTPTPNFFGNADFAYTLTDGNGVIDTANVQLDIVDNTAPDMPWVTILEDANDDGYINIAERVGSVEYSVALPVGALAGETLDINGVQTVLTAADISAGYVTGSLPTPRHNDTVTISVYLFDPAGNSSAVHTDLAVVDLVTPTPAGPLDLVDASDIGISNTDNYTGDMNPDFALPAGSGVPGDTVTIYSDGVAVGTGIVDSDGSAVVSTSISGFTVQKLTYTFTDPAGNESSPSIGLFVEFYDNTLPYQPPSDPSVLGVEQFDAGSGQSVINLLAPQLNEDEDDDDEKVAFFRSVLRSNTFEVSNEIIRRQNSSGAINDFDVAINGALTYEKELGSIRVSNFVGDLDYRMATTLLDNLESNDIQMTMFLDQLNDLADEMRDEFSEISLLAGNAKAGAGVVIAGYAFWIARAAFIASWFATSIPAFSRFDPLMILDAKKADSETLAQIAKGNTE